jgi:AcrR family transcriptional regulator
MRQKTTKAAVRKAEVQAYKRSKILSAAADLFRKNGLEGTTMRAIATAAGYSTGAPYAYFHSKEEIYAELLSTSLIQLTKHVKTQAQSAFSSDARVQAAFKGYFEYYKNNPFELQLGLYLFSSGEVKKQGFSAETNKYLNGKLMSLLGFMANCIHENSNASASDAQTETVDAISYFTGTLILKETGRIPLFGSDPQEMIDRYITLMLKRIKDLE